MDEEDNKVKGEMVPKSGLVNMGKRFVEVQMSNVELEQDMAILRKKFRDLLTSKGQPPSIADTGSRVTAPVTATAPQTTAAAPQLTAAATQMTPTAAQPTQDVTK